MSAQDYYPFGTTMPGRSFRSENYRFGYQGSEKDFDIAEGAYTTPYRQYDSRLARWFSVDPVFHPWESPYAINNGNPIVFKDPDGDTPLTAFVVGAFFEYASIIGEKMLFEDMSFTDANKSLTLRDAGKIGVAGAFSAATDGFTGGSRTAGTWLAKPTNQKIIKKLFQVGMTALESSLKQLLDEKDFSLTDVLIDVLADVGMGHLLKSTNLDKAINKTKNNLDVAKDRVQDLMNRNKPNDKLINKAKDKAESLSKDLKFYETVGEITDKAKDVATDATTITIKDIKDEKIK